jgi:hypothetical protein
MKGKIDSEDGELESRAQWANGEYNERRTKSKRKPGMGHRLGSEHHGKTSTYSSSSRLTSMLRGQSVS